MKTLLESLILDERGERIRVVAGIVMAAAKATLDLAQAVKDLSDSLPESKREDAQKAAASALAWHKVFRDDLDALARYHELHPQPAQRPGRDEVNRGACAT